MSIKWRDFAWSEAGPAGANEHHVFLYLAERADNSGRCFPATPTICKATRLTRNTVRRSIRALEADGFLTVTVGRGHGKSSTYQLREKGQQRTLFEDHDKGELRTLIGVKERVKSEHLKGSNPAHKRVKMETTPHTPLSCVTVNEPSVEPEARAPESGDARPVNPDSGGELLLAHHLLEELSVVADIGVRRVAGEAIRLLAKEGGDLQTAHDFILEAGRHAKAAGEVITRFWFTDQAYRPRAPAKSRKHREREAKWKDFMGEASGDD